MQHKHVSLTLAVGVLITVGSLVCRDTTSATAQPRATGTGLSNLVNGLGLPQAGCVCMAR